MSMSERLNACICFLYQELDLTSKSPSELKSNESENAHVDKDTCRVTQIRNTWTKESTLQNLIILLEKITKGKTLTQSEFQELKSSEYKILNYFAVDFASVVVGQIS